MTQPNVFEIAAGVAILILAAQIFRLFRWFRSSRVAGEESSASPYGTGLLVLGTSISREQLHRYVADWPSHHPSDASLAIADVAADGSVGVELYETATGQLLWEGVVGKVAADLEPSGALRAIATQVSVALGVPDMQPQLAS